MAMDWTKGNLPYLKRQLETGSVALFLGAGFSEDAKNSINESPPIGTKLASLLVDKCGHFYENEPLSIAYETAEMTIGTKALHEFLLKMYTIKSFSPWYHIIKDITWHRIYTINIDDLVQHVYSSGYEQKLKTIVCPDNIIERDQYFSPLQCIHLHGHIGELDKKMTFTLPDFAEQTVVPNPWYQQMMEDLYTVPFVFIGTNIEEPQFQHYLALRERKGKGQREHRPKSFIVNPNISSVREKTFTYRNIDVIKHKAQDFFETLKEVADFHKYKLNCVIKTAFPYIDTETLKFDDDCKIERYYYHIRPNNLPITSAYRGDSFFLGAEPTWYDIDKEHDANREVNNKLQEEIQQDDIESSRCFVLHGPAGCGKTTSLMRTAYNIALNGQSVYYAKNIERINIEPILKIALEIKDKKIFLFIDNFRKQLKAIKDVKDVIMRTDNLVLVLGERTNTYFHSIHTIEELCPREIKMPDLCTKDVIEIIEKLEKHHFLGVLKNKTKATQINEFLGRASKQLLVAMKEATSGKGFDVILKSEYEDLNAEARIAYLICCLAVDSGAPGIYRRHLIACMGSKDFQTNAMLEESLRGIIIPANETNTLVKPRHRLIAHWVSREIANVEEKYNSLTRYLIQISSDIIPSEVKRRSPTYLAYRGMINSDRAWDALNHDEDRVFALYQQLTPYYEHDFLFWLHFGMVYIKAGYLDMAENYLNQSLALFPNSHHTLHQLGILYLKQACKSENAIVLKDKTEEAKKLLKNQILSRGDYDPYPYAAFLTHVSRWYLHAGQSLIKSEDWNELKKISEEALRKYPRNKIITEAVKEIDKVYLLKNITKQ